MINDVRVVLDNLPTTVKGFVYHDSNNCPVIVLNARMPEEVREKTYRHECDHILREDMDNTDYREYTNG